ncbi:MAG TPA: EAL domain-containing protein [Candidatus Baltobacteraceae bacterium]|nr:EAL domain-containing protein [Candidatus Baltobacteraceae bacterium]
MKHRLGLSARGIVVTYAVVAAAWIALSDGVAHALAPSQDALAAISTLKGWGFVLVTSALLAVLLARYDAERTRRQRELEVQATELERADAHLARLNHVLHAVALANQALIRTSDETALLQAFCSIITEQGAFLAAWVGYREDRPPGLIRAVASAGPLEPYLDRIELSWNDLERGSLGPAGTSIREGRTVVVANVAAEATLVWRAEMLERGFRSMVALPLRDADVALGTLVIYAGEPGAFGGDEVALLEELASNLANGVMTLRGRAAAARGETERRRLVTAIEQSAEAVVITDTFGAIEYVNPAFERVTGYGADEVLGRNPRILKSGVQGPGFYAAMWAALTNGQSFVGDLTNRRKDGSLFQEEAVISPIHDETGAVTSYVAVKRDVTRERALEVSHDRATRERAMIAGTLADLRVLSSAPATAEAICRQVVGLSGVASASLLYFTLQGPAMPLAFLRADGVPVRLRQLPFQRSRILRERSEGGPWVETRVHRPWHPYDRLHQELGTKATAYAPVRHGGRLIGLLTAASSDADAVEHLTESLPALLEFAGFAGELVGPAVVDLTEAGSIRERITEVIRTAAFQPVFQPVVDLASGVRVGYEALTRFSDGTAPELVFADARVAGLETDLELATLGAAIAASVDLPVGAWVSLNVSPSLVVGDRRLAGVLRRAERPIVLEVTEHAAVEDYAALRTAIGRLRPEVRVAVDDAGAGVANFNHIVELRPAFVKLDLQFVRGIEADRTRQALVLGLLHFASASASQTIAEGVETEEELATLRELGVPLAQGYLLGRPASVAAWQAQTSSKTVPTRRSRRPRRDAAVRGVRPQLLR